MAYGLGVVISWLVLRSLGSDAQCDCRAASEAAALRVRARWLEQRTRGLDATVVALRREIEALQLQLLQATATKERGGEEGRQLHGGWLNNDSAWPTPAQHDPETDTPVDAAAPSATMSTLPPLPLLPPAVNQTESSRAGNSTATASPSEVSSNLFVIAVFLIVGPAAIFLGFACLCRRKARRRA